MQGRQQGHDSILELNKLANKPTFSDRERRKLKRRYTTTFDYAARLLTQLSLTGTGEGAFTRPVPYEDREGHRSELLLRAAARGSIVLQVSITNGGGEPEQFPLFTLTGGRYGAVSGLIGDRCGNPEVNEVIFLLNGMEKELKSSPPPSDIV